MKNLAIVIAVSEYNNITSLPGCENDYKLIAEILRSTNKYTEILQIHENTDSLSVKENLTTFFSRIKGEEIGELFFYYTGHGAYDMDEEDLKFALTDYSSQHYNTTTLSNNFIDQQIRNINPKLTVKVVDACNSGIPYIKGDLEVSQIFEQKKAINNLYFMFSSHSDQFSYVNTISDFTKSFAEAILTYRGNEISYSSIIEYVKDKFAQSSKQTPYFVTQGAMSDVFCSITETIKNIDITKYEKQIVDVEKEEVSLVESIKRLSQSYVSKEEIDQILSEIKEEFNELINIEFFKEIFSLEVIEVSNYVDILDIDAIAKWVDKNSNDYFLEIETEKINNNNVYGITLPFINPKIEFVGISTRLNTTFDSLKVKLNPIHQALAPYQCNVVFLISRYKVTVFYKFITFHETGWEVYDYGDRSVWKHFYRKYNDRESLMKRIREINKEFFKYVESSIQERLKLHNSVDKDIK
ncbi:caspase family protein [Paenibacillus bovis]|uniref:Peptidase C14 caspase domain-containing protein n=1 Tax=Paenibacillus bovis TaxID=1616788 RepID=A0A172ZJT9_9BACL|nr:caspase family protein [Paenibacillus bovis]ANF97858.1 hypothetical protein AR543_18785 [Paenibacillus bovis]